jgi:type VI secretion system protein ImpF
VLRDLGWLLNTTSLAAAAVPLEAAPLATRSVLNFGLPDLAGKTASSLDRHAVARAIRQAIWDFEPRILRDSLRVVAAGGRSAAGLNQLAFEIQGELWGLPLPERLYVRTELDLELGAVRLFDLDGAGPR